jgi:hypothetical protein
MGQLEKVMLIRRRIGSFDDAKRRPDDSGHRDPVGPKNGGIGARRRQRTSVIYRGSDPTVVAFCELVCAPLRNDARAKTG